MLEQEGEEQRAAVRERIAAVDKSIAEVQKKLDELNAAAHRSGADLAVRQDRLEDAVKRLRGEVEEAQHKLGQLEAAAAAYRDEVEGRFAALKGSGALDEWEARKKAAEIPRPADKAAFFALAQRQERGGEPGVARQLYEEYVRRWPTDPRAADAWFRIGEIHFADKRYRDAILAFGKVAQDFPRSPRTPDATLRTAEAMLALDLKDDARAIFEEVVARYPKTAAARTARARLKGLGKRTGR